MISGGNRKTGNVYSFNLPPLATCPGATPACSAACYARRGNYARPKNLKFLWRNAAERLVPGWAQSMAFDITRKGINLFRVHVAGDFDSARYVRQWVKIARACPGTTFYGYSRSWKVFNMRAALAELAALPNFRLWLSCDRDSGRPTGVPGAAGVCYLSRNDSDWPDYPTDLVFRDRKATVVKYAPNGSLVCPTENGTQIDLNCDVCRLCFTERKVPSREPSGSRIPLTLVA